MDVPNHTEPFPCPHASAPIEVPQKVGPSLQASDPLQYSRKELHLVSSLIRRAPRYMAPGADYEPVACQWPLSRQFLRGDNWFKYHPCWLSRGAPRHSYRVTHLRVETRRTPTLLYRVWVMLPSGWIENPEASLEAERGKCRCVVRILPTTSTIATKGDLSSFCGA